MGPSRNGNLSSTGEYKHRKMAEMLDKLTVNKDFESGIAPYSLSGDISYEAVIRLSNHVKRELLNDYYGEVCSIRCCKKINEWGGVLVPVIWHKHLNLEGSVHVYKARSKKSWVYLNMELSEHEFLFLALRELGRLLTVSAVEKEKSEWVSRLFATNILLNEKDAFYHYHELMPFKGKLNKYEQVNYIMRIAKELRIFPLAILWRLNEYALHFNCAPLEIEELLVTRLEEFDSCSIKQTADFFEHVAVDDEPIRKHHYESVLKWLDSDFMKIFNESSVSMNEFESAVFGGDLTQMRCGVFDIQ